MNCPHGLAARTDEAHHCDTDPPAADALGTDAARRWRPPPVPATSAARRGIARRLAHIAAGRVPIQARYPDGRVVGGGRAGDPVLDLVDPDAFYARMSRNPKLGLGESYMAGDWRAGEGSDLADVLTPFAADVPQLVRGPALTLRRLLDRAHPEHRRNTVQGARRNIADHYDLPGELFETFLDPTLTYSAGLYDDAPDTDHDSAPTRLEAAQHRKIAAVLDLADVGAGTHLLEIGTGWGATAMAAGVRGAQVRTITLSALQQAQARARISAAGLSDRVEVDHVDYREVDGRYDAVVSVEMIEAVGQEYWPDYMRAIAELLTDDGVAALQSITMSHERLLATRTSHGWIQEYIFPGGLIPSIEALTQAADTADLQLRVERAFGHDYATTLRAWRETFTARRADLAPLGLGLPFERAWEFYLAYCEAGFRSGYIDVHHLTLRRRTRRGDDRTTTEGTHG